MLQLNNNKNHPGDLERAEYIVAIVIGSPENFIKNDIFKLKIPTL